MKKTRNIIITVAVAVSLLFAGYTQIREDHNANPSQVNVQSAESVEDIPAYSGSPYVVVQENIPDFTAEDMTTEAFETYSELDSLGRCQEAVACVGTEIMPTEKRGDIGEIKPTGWHSDTYDFVGGGNLYNRCHLIGYQLTGENANERNLVTGTRYMNVSGMLPFENMVGDYVKETGNHVLYRVTPIFSGTDLVAQGVRMEGKSVEDDGEGILFHVYVYNVQPGVEIDYVTGDNREAKTNTAIEIDGENNGRTRVSEYILNTNSRKFHSATCSGAAATKEQNKETYAGSREELISQGYDPCGQCNP